jgi:flagellar hook assembly protein FlgD
MNFVFYIPFEDQVQITLFNILGQEIVQLVNAEYPEGTHTVHWNGQNKNGIIVANGIYFYSYKFNYESISVNKLIKF